jgi:RNA polymerase sigma-70 factor (ECF subfamily)
MESFLQTIERPAYRMAVIASRNREDALDLVQESLCRFVDRYADRPPEEWKPLFYRILHNCIRDFNRRRMVRRCLQTWFGGENDKDGNEMEKLADEQRPDPEHAITVNHAFAALQAALSDLPYRQQQAFLLRGWEEISGTDTARIMGCSEGSVKTHYSRAIHTLREKLGDHWP